MERIQETACLTHLFNKVITSATNNCIFNWCFTQTFKLDFSIRKHNRQPPRLEILNEIANILDADVRQRRISNKAET